MQAWGHGELGDHVDLELAAELVERQELERAGGRDAGVVDERVELVGAKRLDLGGVRDVELDRRYPPTELVRRAHAGEHVRAEVGQHERRRATDARRGAGDQHCAAVEHAASLPVGRAGGGRLARPTGRGD